MTAAERRRILGALADFDAGREDEARATLAHLAGVPVPPAQRMVQVPVVGTIGEAEERSAKRINLGVNSGGNINRARLVPQPKPRPRTKDPDALARFRHQNPTCILRGCGRPAEAHHIVKRSQGGSDVEENLLALCGGPQGHHTGREGIHTLTVRVFLARYVAQLPVETLEKIRAALGARLEVSDGSRI
jgi:hypothetical protein